MCIYRCGGIGWFKCKFNPRPRAWLRLGGKGRSQAGVLAGVTNLITTVNIFFFSTFKIKFCRPRAAGFYLFIFQLHDGIYTMFK